MFKLKFKDLNEQRKCLNRPEKGVDYRMSMLLRPSTFISKDTLMNAEALAGFVTKGPQEPFGSIYLTIYLTKMFAGGFQP